MQPRTLLNFSESRPFEAFRVFMADGRVHDVTHPEMMTTGAFGLTLWIFYANGQIEALDGDSITALRTLGTVDPDDFIAPARPEEG
jgi:hypothetical protein